MCVLLLLTSAIEGAKESTTTVQATNNATSIDSTSAVTGSADETSTITTRTTDITETTATTIGIGNQTNTSTTAKLTTKLNMAPLPEAISETSSQEVEKNVTSMSRSEVRAMENATTSSSANSGSSQRISQSVTTSSVPQIAKEQETSTFCGNMTDKEIVAGRVPGWLWIALGVAFIDLMLVSLVLLLLFLLCRRRWARKAKTTNDEISELKRQLREEKRERQRLQDAIHVKVAEKELVFKSKSPTKHRSTQQRTSQPKFDTTHETRTKPKSSSPMIPPSKTKRKKEEDVDNEEESEELMEKSETDEASPCSEEEEMAGSMEPSEDANGVEDDALADTYEVVGNFPPMEPQINRRHQKF